ncbi:MAG: hypothetical protein R2932_03260 [Caldilineaceae bacterium]
MTLWVLTMIAIPILRWVIGDAVLHWGVITSVTLLVVAVLAILHQEWRSRRTVRTVVPIVCMAWLLEWVGHTTGYPLAITITPPYYNHNWPASLCSYRWHG